MVVAVITLVLAAGLLAQQADRATTEAMARRATDRLQALQREADALAAQERTLLGDLRGLELDRQIKIEQLKQIESDAAGVQTELDATNARMQQVQTRESADLPALRARLVELYKLGQGRYLRLLLSTAELRRVGEAARSVSTLARLDRERFARHQRTLGELKAIRAELVQRGRQLQALRGDAQRAETAAARAAAAREALIRDIDQRRDLNAELAGELQAAQQKLQLALREIASGAAAAEPVALPLRPFRGDLAWPIAGPVSRRFGRAANQRSPTSHGIEIAAAEGTPAQAVHEGVVAFADTFAGFGKLVIVDHGGQAFSLYGDLLDIAVERGAPVERGQTIGTVGSTVTGSSALYFELRVDGRPVDPLQWLKKK